MTGQTLGVHDAPTTSDATDVGPDGQPSAQRRRGDLTPAGDLTPETEAANEQKPGAPAGALDQDVGNNGGHQGEGSRHRSLDGSSTHLLA